MLIETAHLRKVYGDTVAVDDLTLSVAPGEVFGFLGPNGAGKTTTVKMLLGLVRPTGGDARLFGYAPGDPRAMARVGFLPEHFRFHPWLTGAGFLDLHARLYGLDAAERNKRIPRLLARVGLADRAGVRLAEFSKGMSQRIGLAQALINDPDLVVLDEPTSGLDPLGRREVRDLIKELRDAGVSVFLNSHFLSEVEVTSNRVAIVKRGRVVRMGTLAELTHQALELEIRASGLTADCLAGLAQWGRVTAPPAAISSADGACVRLIMSLADEDIIPRVAEWVVGSGAQLYALAPQHLSLEELFMRTMAEDS
jgi:ABC-2 type transport system ATP-binding protein